MSVLEQQPQYELQVYKLLLGAADLAGGGVKWSGKVEEASRWRILVYRVGGSISPKQEFSSAPPPPAFSPSNPFFPLSLSPA